MEVSVMNKPIAILVLLGFFALSACTGNKNSSPDRFTPQEEAEQQLQIEETAEEFQKYGLDPETAKQETRKYISAKSLVEKNRIFMTATGQDDNEAQKFNQAINNIEISEDRRNTISQSIEIERILRDNSKRAKALIQDNCVLDKDRFAQGEADNLYGKACLDGKYLEIKTAKTGILEPAFSSFSANKENGEQDIQEEVDFLSTSYKVKYSISTDSGDAKDYALLLKFLKEDEKFIGGLEKSYRIIFRIFKDYLVLYKASKDPDDFPQNERMTGYANSGLQKEGEYYMIPFIGYPISFCVAEPIRNSNNQITNQNRINCDNISQNNSKDVPYIQLDTTRKEVFDPIIKTDWLPIDYFEDEWYYVSSLIESKASGELADPTTPAMLVTFEKSKGHLELVDASITKNIEGTVRDTQKKVVQQIPVEWNDFELDLDGQQFNSFAERNYKPGTDHTDKPYIKIKFEEFNRITNSNSEFSNLVVMPDFFAFTQTHTNQSNGTKTKIRHAVLKSLSLDSEGFKPRRWFRDDFDTFYGIFPVRPEQTPNQASHTADEQTKYFRMQKFNTSLSAKEEETSKTKIIKWYYSKNSTTDSEYRASVEKAIDIYNKAFASIMMDACPKEIKNKKNCPKIQLELVSDKPQDLGDIRHNIINLIWDKKQVSRGKRGLLLGKAPSSVDPNTGQIIGAVANIIINNTEEILNTIVKNYIRYEVFQKDNKTDEENAIHVTTPYLREKIADNCSKVTEFINQVNANTLKRTALGDREAILSCSEKLTKKTILNTILHELGHNFGLAHNFMCSTDAKNFYDNREEMEKIFGANLVDIDKDKEDQDIIPKSSCVMDYLRIDQPRLNVLGKYDLATLRFLYANQAEVLVEESNDTERERDVKDTVLNLQLDEEPLNQTSLSQNDQISGYKYLRCTDRDLSLKELMCKDYDYGSSPKEVIEEKYKSLKRLLNSQRYRYDTVIEDFAIRATGFPNLKGAGWMLEPFGKRLQTRLLDISKYYDKWLSLVDDLFPNNPTYRLYQLNNPNDIETYTKRLYDHYISQTVSEEYKSYYPVRETFKQIVMDWLFLEEMTCQLQHSETKQEDWFTLEFLQNQIIDKSELYVEDCYSESIKNLAESRGYVVIRQKGYENQISGSYYTNKEHSNFKPDIINLFWFYRYLNIREGGKIDRLTYDQKIINRLSKEPDMLQELDSKAQELLLNRDTFKSFYKIEQISSLNNFIQATVLKSTKNNPVIFSEHNDNYKSYRYNLGLNTFYDLYEEPLKNGTNGIPFLQEVWNKYNGSQKETGFLKFLEEQPEVVKWGDTLIWSYKKDSLVAKALINFNKNIEDLEKIRQKQDLDLTESYEKYTLENEQTIFKNMFSIQ